MSKSLWVMFAGIISFEGPPQFSWSLIAWDSWIIVSAWPWMISVGHFTFFITSIFSKRSRTSRLAKVPRNVLTAYFKEVYGESRINAYMLGYSAANAQAGPEPIDLPINMISLYSYFKYLTRNYITSSAFNWMVSASEHSVLYIP